MGSGGESTILAAIDPESPLREGSTGCEEGCRDGNLSAKGCLPCGGLISLPDASRYTHCFPANSLKGMHLRRVRLGATERARTNSDRDLDPGVRVVSLDFFGL